MKPITIYTTTYCPYCVKAKQLLAGNGFAFTEVDVTEDPAARAWLVATTGRRTVPQLFVDQQSIGGCDDLEALIKRGAHEAWR
ncbi:MAG: glutaredoxin 3 [Deltaproteobacteria bacterium]|nr:glutaredoxin 3 [Deltaproteobacteria bacterium]